MKSQDLSTELGAPGARDLLENAQLARLAFTGLDGDPLVVPVGFFWDGSAVVMCTATTAPKVKAIAAHPAVAISIDVGSTPAEAKALLLRGQALLDTVEGVPEEFIHGSAKSLDAAGVAEFRAGTAAMYDEMVRIRVIPDWAKFYDFGAGRMPGFLRDLAAGA